MGADMFYTVQEHNRRQLGDLQQAVNELLELWDAFNHPHCEDGFEDVASPLADKMEKLRSIMQRPLR